MNHYRIVLQGSPPRDQVTVQADYCAPVPGVANKDGSTPYGYPLLEFIKGKEVVFSASVTNILYWERVPAPSTTIPK